MISASTRGSTSTLTGSRPITRSASISSRIRIEPSSAVMALPERPATMMAVRSGATSRSARMPTRSTVKTVAPKNCSWKAPCWATMPPIRNDIRKMMGTARTPATSIWRATAGPRNVDGRSSDLAELPHRAAEDEEQPPPSSATESTVSPISSRRVDLRRRTAFPSSASTSRTRSSSAARSAPTPFQTTWPPPSAKCRSAGPAERRRPCRALRPRRGR